MTYKMVATWSDTHLGSTHNSRNLPPNKGLLACSFTAIQHKIFPSILDRPTVASSLQGTYMQAAQVGRQRGEVPMGARHYAMGLITSALSHTECLAQLWSEPQYCNFHCIKATATVIVKENYLGCLFYYGKLIKNTHSA